MKIAVGFVLLFDQGVNAEFYKELYYRLHLGTRFCHFGPFWPGGQNGKISETTEFLLKYATFLGWFFQLFVGKTFC